MEALAAPLLSDPSRPAQGQLCGSSGTAPKGRPAWALLPTAPARAGPAGDRAAASVGVLPAASGFSRPRRGKPPVVIEVKLHVPATPDEVFAVLADGWSYAGWVVGASHIRQVDTGWPRVGTRIHHSLGAWPVQVKDTSTARAGEPGRFLELDAGLWPLGQARIRLELTEVAGGTDVLMAEEITKGPLSLLPKPAQALFLAPRNRESLRRLAALAVRRENGADF